MTMTLIASLHGQAKTKINDTSSVSATLDTGTEGCASPVGLIPQNSGMTTVPLRLYLAARGSKTGTRHSVITA